MANAGPVPVSILGRAEVVGPRALFVGGSVRPVRAAVPRHRHDGRSPPVTWRPRGESHFVYSASAAQADRGPAFLLLAELTPVAWPRWAGVSQEVSPMPCRLRCSLRRGWRSTTT